MITPYNTVTTYYKVRLVPVAEYVPEGFLSGIVQSFSGDLISASPGSGCELFSLKEGVVFSTLICYEDIFSELARDTALAGAQLLVTMINTQRFDHSSQPMVHLRRARLTAIAVEASHAPVHEQRNLVRDRRSSARDRYFAPRR